MPKPLWSTPRLHCGFRRSSVEPWEALPAGTPAPKAWPRPWQSPPDPLLTPRFRLRAERLSRLLRGEQPKLAAESDFAEQVLGQRGDLLAFQDGVPRHSSDTFLQPDMGWGRAQSCARRNHENVVGQAVARINRDDERRPALRLGLSRNFDPIEAASQRPAVHPQLSPSNRPERSAQEASSSCSAASRER
jgi:hypothetical protein